MTRKILLTTILVTLLGGGAVVAQSTGQRIVIERPSPNLRQEGMVRVQLTMQMFIAGPTDDSEEAEKARARSRQALYELAGKECDVLRETIASTCRLENVNINLNRQAQQNMQGYNVNGSMAFQITLK
jgi:hypothetical protein